MFKAVQNADGTEDIVPLSKQEIADLAALAIASDQERPGADFIPVPMLRQRIEKLGMWDGFAAYLVANPAEMLKVLTVDKGLVDPAYPALTVAFDALGVPAEVRAYILAPAVAGVPDV